MTISFRFCGIGYGWLWMKIQIDRKYIVWSFDEALSDPLPGMIRMYTALKQGHDAVWSVERGGTIEFKTTFSDEKDKVKLKIKIKGTTDGMIADETIPGAEYETMKNDTIEDLEGEGEFATDYLVWEFENFFSLLTSSKYYPIHYPCYSMLKEETYRFFGEDTEFYEKHKTEHDDNYWEEYDKRIFAENARLNKYGETFYKKFDEMMNTYIVPDNW